MPIIPFAAAVGAALGTSAAVGGTLVAAGGIAAGLGVAQAVQGAQQSAAAKKAFAAAQGVQPNASQTVAQTGSNRAAQLGGAALISTSPTGVEGTSSTRRALLGNDI